MVVNSALLKAVWKAAVKAGIKAAVKAGLWGGARAEKMELKSVGAWVVSLAGELGACWAGKWDCERVA